MGEGTIRNIYSVVIRQMAKPLTCVKVPSEVGLERKGEEAG